ncbi:DUF5133 domain-containing protein [Streptomyces sp. NPDC049916]|uniref:DUF5133 domain-containing protein n=1 Tax=Streptomyces sp. NPDC049916 TaxID=3155156 RepID=UPI0034366861
MPRPETVRSLLTRYNELRLEHSKDSANGLDRSLEDVSYTLCVTTGTRTVQDALHAAERILRTPSDRMRTVAVPLRLKPAERIAPSEVAPLPSAS